MSDIRHQAYRDAAAEVLNGLVSIETLDAVQGVVEFCVNHKEVAARQMLGLQMLSGTREENEKLVNGLVGRLTPYLQNSTDQDVARYMTQMREKTLLSLDNSGWKLGLVFMTALTSRVRTAALTAG